MIDDEGARYVYGAGLVSQVTSSETYYYLADGLGSTMVTVDSDGDVANSYTYDVFGQTRSESGGQANEFQFAGQQVDGSTGLQYLRARYLDMEMGRFISRDPLADIPGWNGNSAAYADGQPTGIVDPSGLEGGGCVEGCSRYATVGAPDGRDLQDGLMWTWLDEAAGTWAICARTSLIGEYIIVCFDPRAFPSGDDGSLWGDVFSNWCLYELGCQRNQLAIAELVADCLFDPVCQYSIVTVTAATSLAVCKNEKRCALVYFIVTSVLGIPWDSFTDNPFDGLGKDDSKGKRKGGHGKSGRATIPCADACRLAHRDVYVT